MTESMWHSATSVTQKPENSGSLWLKLPNNNDKAIVVFVGGPYAREVCFADGRYTLATDELKKAGHRSTHRVAINVVLYDSHELKIFEMSVALFHELVAVKDKYGVEGWAYEIRRKGAAKDPKTTYSILPDRPLTDEEKTLFKDFTPHPLPPLYGDPTPRDAESSEPRGRAFDPGAKAGAAAATAAASATTIDAKTTHEIVTTLKTLEPQLVTLFLEKFHIERVKDLPVSALSLAKEFVSELTRPKSKDPFAL